VARKRKQEQMEAARREEEEAVASGLQIELRASCATETGMSLLYRRCSSEDRDFRSSGMGGDDPRLLTIASSVAKDLSLLQRAGFQV
jgi:hypothetical protein